MKKLLITALETLVLVIAWLAFMLWLQFLTNWHIGDVNVFAFVALVWVFATGSFFAHFQGSLPTLAKKSYREDAGFAVLLGTLCALIAPVGLLIALCLTGFTQHGWQLPFIKPRG